MISEYEVYRMNPNPVQARNILDAVYNHMSNMKDPGKTLLLLPPLIELSTYLNEGEDLFDQLTELCQNCPLLLAHIIRITIANDCAPMGLFEDVSV
jgi:hypothetical protein